MDRGLGGLEIEGDDAGDAGTGEATLRERRVDQCPKSLRRSAQLGADAQSQDRRVIDQTVWRAGDCAVGDQHLEIRLIRPGDRSRAQPCGITRLDGELSRRTFQQPNHDALGIAGIGQGPARRWHVEGDAEAVVAGGGNRRRHAQRIGNQAGKRIRAMVTAEQRHHGRAVLGHGDHRRLVRLVAEGRGHRTDQDAAGAQADDRAAFGEQPAKASGRLQESLVRIAVGAGWGVDSAAGQERPQPQCQGRAPRA